jgi:uncharacterized protein
MKIFVQAKPDSYENQLEKIDSNHYRISVKEPPVKGKANFAIIKLLAKHFGITSSQIRIVSGYTSRQKVIDITLT